MVNTIPLGKNWVKKRQMRASHDIVFVGLTKVGSSQQEETH